MRQREKKDRGEKESAAITGRKQKDCGSVGASRQTMQKLAVFTARYEDKYQISACQ